MEHGMMGPSGLGVLYLVAVLVAVLGHAFNVYKAPKLDRLTVADHVHHRKQMERNQLYICAGHIPMAVAWAFPALLGPGWGLLVGGAMLFSEGWLAFRTFLRAKGVYGL